MTVVGRAVLPETQAETGLNESQGAEGLIDAERASDENARTVEAHRG